MAIPQPLNVDGRLRRITVTPSEAAWLEAERHRIALDSRDWNSEPYVTALELREMSPHMRAWLMGQPETWRYGMIEDCYFNLDHSANADQLARELALATLRRTG